MGPNALQTLGATIISIVTGASGTVSNAIEQYKSGRLQAVPEGEGGENANYKKVKWEL